MGRIGVSLMSDVTRFSSCLIVEEIDEGKNNLLLYSIYFSSPRNVLLSGFQFGWAMWKMMSFSLFTLPLLGGWSCGVYQIRFSQILITSPPSYGTFILLLGEVTLRWVRNVCSQPVRPSQISVLRLYDSLLVVTVWETNCIMQWIPANMTFRKADSLPSSLWRWASQRASWRALLWT